MRRELHHAARIQIDISDDDYICYLVIYYLISNSKQVLLENYF